MSKKGLQKPVGIHLTPGAGGYNWDPTYYAGADYIFLQLGFSAEEHGYATVSLEEKQAILLQALNLGIPVIAAEYSLDSSSPEAKAFGDWACANGAVGTGNGRTVEACGQAEEDESLSKSMAVRSPRSALPSQPFGLYRPFESQLPCGPRMIVTSSVSIKPLARIIPSE